MIVHWLPNCRVIDQVYGICKEHKFDELDESMDWITIEYVGDYKWIDTNDYDHMKDYFNAVENENRIRIHPKFLKCWGELQNLNGKYNIFKEWGWYNDDYMVYYLFFTEEFKEKLFKEVI